MGRWLLTLRVRAISLMVSSGRKLWLRYPSFLLSSPDLPPWVGKAREAWVELSESKAYSENALYCWSEEPGWHLLVGCWL